MKDYLLGSSPNCNSVFFIRSFSLSNRNLVRLNWVFHFCNLYVAHRDFDLAKRIIKHKPLNWKEAEGLSDFCNQIVTTKESKPQDFISDEDTNANNAVDKYLALKKSITQAKYALGAKNKDKLYKSVKAFYRKKIYCYQMDSFFTWLINGFFMYTNNIISFDDFKRYYCFEVSLFTGKRNPIDLKKVIKIYQCILNS
jgi:hypothetical protein